MPETQMIVRHWQILRMLSAREHGLTVATLSEETRVSIKTMRRDLLLLSQVGFPLEESNGRHGTKSWRLRTPDGIPPLQMRFDEAASLYLALKQLQPWMGTLVGEAARSAWNKVKASFSESVLAYLDKLSSVMHVTDTGVGQYSNKAHLLDGLMQAIEDTRIARITYQSQRSTEPVTNELHPYGVIQHRGSLYLVAYAPHHREVRHYKVDRISDVDVQTLKFPKPTDFDLESHLAGSFGVYRGEADQTIRVRVRFAADVARYVQEKRWHASQKLTPQPDRSVIAEFELRATEELKAWVLSFGPKAEVLEPESLRQEIAQEVAQLHEMYRPAPARTARRLPR